MPIWTFVRHGQSVANQEGWLAGHQDAPLTEQGRAEARAAGTQLRTPLPTRAFCSDLSRAHETARLMLAGLDVPLTITPKLRERTCGALERRSIAEVAAHPEYPARLNSWTGRPPGGESLLDVALRAVSWLVSVDDDSSGETLVVAHGALITTVIVVLDGRSRTNLDQWRLGNCEMVRREIASGTWIQRLDELRCESSNVYKKAGG